MLPVEAFLGFFSRIRTGAHRRRTRSTAALLANALGGASVKSANAEEFFDNSLLQELAKEGFFARLQSGKGL